MTNKSGIMCWFILIISMSYFKSVILSCCMWWFGRKKKIKLNPSALRRNNRSTDPYNNASVVSDWLSKLVKEFVTLPLTIASTILTQSKYLIISNLAVVIIHLSSYLYWLLKERDERRNSKILLSILIAIGSVVLLYAALNYYVPHILIANQVLRILFRLNIWASAINLFLTCRSFILALWYSFVFYVLMPIVTWFDQRKTTRKGLKFLYKDIFFFRKKVTDDEALSLGQRYVLEEFIMNYYDKQITKRDEQELKDAAEALNKILDFLVKRVNRKYYSLFGFIINKREIDNLKSMIEKLLRGGDIKEVVDYAQKRINYKLTQITQIEELLALIKPTEPTTPRAPILNTKPTDTVRLHANLLLAFNLTRQEFDPNDDDCQAEIKKQLIDQKAIYDQEAKDLKELIPDKVQLCKVCSP